MNIYTRILFLLYIYLITIIIIAITIITITIIASFIYNEYKKNKITTTTKLYSKSYIL